MNALVVRPVRFTSQVREMQRFLELIGLRPWLVSDRGGWADLACAAGRVALHDAATAESDVLPGQTTLSFEGADLYELARTLEDAGVAEVSVYDEAYGRVLTCRDPDGAVIAVDDAPDDLYGYQVHEDPVAAASLRVTPVKFTDPAGPYGSFLEALGLRADGPLNPYYVNFLAGGGAQGQVGLHYLVSDDLPFAAGGGTTAVGLNFETAEPLEDIAARLADGGFTAEIRNQDSRELLGVTDPDGQLVQVHGPASPS
jgi:hypothetical protein